MNIRRLTENKCNHNDCQGVIISYFGVKQDLFLRKQEETIKKWTTFFHFIEETRRLLLQSIPETKDDIIHCN
ncbi:MAG: hypothetical protein ACI81G_001671 [Gammaproteobacteria bacterium]|jgi:hypothetical protein